MTTVFLSCARGGGGEPHGLPASFVTRLHHDLAAVGFDVWFDRVSLPCRLLTFHQEIADAIQNLPGRLSRSWTGLSQALTREPA